MKINNNNDDKSKEFKEKFKQFIADKKTRWIAIAFPVMIVIMIVQFVLQGVIK